MEMKVEFSHIYEFPSPLSSVAHKSLMCAMGQSFGGVCAQRARKQTETIG